MSTREGIPWTELRDHARESIRADASNEDGADEITVTFDAFCEVNCTDITINLSRKSKVLQGISSTKSASRCVVTTKSVFGIGRGAQSEHDCEHDEHHNHSWHE
jgi:hypothetical protein